MSNHGIEAVLLFHSLFGRFPTEEPSSPFEDLTDMKSKYLLDRINKGADDACWEWKFGLENGYGRAAICGERIMAHRLSWEVFIGQIPEGLFVLHKCDNRKCCNPKHLFLGTIAENNLDRDTKGRHKPLYGTKNGLAKLDYDKARIIRSLSKEGHTQKDLASQFGVDQKAIWMVIHNVTWKEENFARENLERAMASPLQQ